MMIKHLVSRYDKSLIPGLPQATFPGRIEIVKSELEAQRAVEYLLRQPVLGFDTETRPSFKKGRIYKVALLQVSDHQICFLFRLDMIGLTASLLRLLTDTSVIKVALSWHDDLNALQKRASFQCAPFVELQDLSNEFGIADMSLQKLYANLFAQRISKTQQLSNWEAENYTEAQKTYAATDAWACLMLYDEFMRLKESGAYQMTIVPETDQTGEDMVVDARNTLKIKAKTKDVVKEETSSRLRNM